MNNIYVPNDFDIKKVLPKKLQKHEDFAYWLINEIRWHLIMRWNKTARKEAKVRLKYDYLEKVCHHSILTPIMKVLKKKNIIISDDHYIQGVQCRSYTLNPVLLDGKFHLYTPTNKLLIKKLTKMRSEGYKQLTELQKLLLEDLKLIELNELPILTEEELDNEYPKIQAIKDRQFRLTQDDYGRVHTNLTNISGKVRKTITVKGRKLIELDISNSQPLFLSLIISSHKSPINNYSCKLIEEHTPPHHHTTITTAEFEVENNWRKLCENGDLYRFLSSEFEKKYKKKPENIKQMVFVWLYDENRNKPSRIGKLISELFPQVYDFIYESKAHDHRTINHMVQRLESKIVFRIVQRVKTEYPHQWIATIHDSFLIMPEFATMLEDIVEQEFAVYGLKPTLRRK